MIKKRKEKIIKNKNKKGFVILIAIVISGLLTSLGVFISTIAYKELQLSISTEASQKAFFAANSVIECALMHDIQGAGFRKNDDKDTPLISLSCNGNFFKEEGSLHTKIKRDITVSVYFISFEDNGVTNLEITSTKPYAKLKVIKEKIGTKDDKTTIKVFARNKLSGRGVVERAMEVSY